MSEFQVKQICHEPNWRHLPHCSHKSNASSALDKNFPVAPELHVLSSHIKDILSCEYVITCDIKVR